MSDGEREEKDSYIAVDTKDFWEIHRNGLKSDTITHISGNNNTPFALHGYQTTTIVFKNRLQ
jgi:hypothetical protein